MKNFFRHFRFSMFAGALLCLGLGAVLLIWPDISQRAFCYAFGAVLIISGVIQMISYLSSEKKGLLQKLLFAGALVAAVAGVCVLFVPDRVLGLTVIVVGLVLLYHGIMDVKYSFDLKKLECRSWGGALVCGLVTAGLGALLLVNPFESMETLFLIVAIAFLFDGASDMFTVFAVARGEHQAELNACRQEVIEGHGEVVEQLRGKHRGKKAEAAESAEAAPEEAPEEKAAPEASPAADAEAPEAQHE